MEKITKENTQELFNKKSDLNLKEKGKQKRSQIGWSLIWQFCKQNGMKRCNKTYPIEDVIGFIEGLIFENKRQAEIIKGYEEIVTNLKTGYDKNTELKKLVSKLEQKNSELKMQINKTKRTIL